MTGDRTTKLLLAACAVLLLLNLCKTEVPRVMADPPRAPFASSIEQRQQSIEELRQLVALMQKQYDLLASGQLRVVVVEGGDAARPMGTRKGSR